MGKLYAGKKTTSEITELKKLFTMPHRTKQLKRDITIKRRQVTWNIEWKHLTMSNQVYRKRDERKGERDSKDNDWFFFRTDKIH